MNLVSPAERLARSRAAQVEWAARSTKSRVRVLADLRRAIAEQRGKIVAAVTSDTGTTELDVLAAEVLVTLEQMLFYEHKTEKLLARRRVASSPVLFPKCSFYEERQPLGVALIYGASNYPFQLAMVPAVTALYAGNSVVLKVSERTPSVARIIERLTAGLLPPDLLQVVDDAPERAVQHIDAGPDIVFFTGSSRNGGEVAKRAGQRLIPTVMELGGKDAAIVFADCDVTRTVEGIVYGAFLNAGQVCTGIKRLYVEKTIYRSFVDKLRERTTTLRVGSGLGCDLGTVEDETLRRCLQEQVADALARGARLETTDTSPQLPTILSDVPADSRLLTEETFGPVLIAAPFDTESEAVSLANDSPFALGASVWTADLSRGRRVASALHAGNCAVNDVIRNVGNPHAGFGGNKSSGYGRYHGPHGLFTFSRSKTVMIVRTGPSRERHWFPFTKKTQDGLDTLIELRHRPNGWFRAIRRTIKRLCVGLLLAASTARAQGTPTGHLRLDVQVPGRDCGQLAWAVFDSPDGFPDNKAKAIRRGFAPALTPGAELDVDVGPLRTGRYAVAVYLDENGNGRLDYRLLGIPKEPVGASNNPRSRMGAPRFQDCVFPLGSEDKTIVIRLVDPK